MEKMKGSIFLKFGNDQMGTTPQTTNDNLNIIFFWNK